MEKLRLQLLGGFTMVADGEEVQPPTKKSKALLAFLASQPGQHHTREKLTTLLWGNSGEAQARDSLRQAVSSLRKSLGAHGRSLVADRNAVHLSPASVEVDAFTFRKLCLSASPNELPEAIELYRGEFLEGLVIEEEAFENWLSAERRQLNELLVGCLSKLLDRYCDEADAARGIPIAMRLLALDPLQERAHRALMQFYTQEGRRGAALRQFEECRQYLNAQLGVAPEPETVDAYQTIRERPSTGRVRERAALFPPERPSATDPPTPAPAVYVGGLGRMTAASRRPWSLVTVVAVVALLTATTGWWATTPAREQTEGSEVLPTPDTPSLAVLPFRSISGTKDQDRIAAGLTDHLSTVLSRVPDLVVVTNELTDPEAVEALDTREIARRLGVKHILKGSIQRGGNRLRITAQLIDGADGVVHWSEHYDRELEHLFDLQDAIVKRVLVGLQVQLTAGDSARIASIGTNSLDAWLLQVEAAAEAARFTRDGNRRAAEFFQAAHEADPGWGRPLAGLAGTFWNSARFGWGDDRKADIRRGIELAEQAVLEGPEDPYGYMYLGNLLIEDGRLDDGIFQWEKALTIAPNDQKVLFGLAWNVLWTDDTKRSLALYRQAKKLSPRQPWSLLAAEGLALHFSGQHELALESLTQAAGLTDHPIPHSRLAAVYADLGQDDAAQREVDWILDRDPKATMNNFTGIFRFRDHGKAKWYASLLLKAGLPSE